MKRLERAGLVLVRQGDVTQPFLSVPGIRYQVGRQELQIYLYPGAAERERDLRTIDPVTVAPRDSAVAWAADPTLIISNNVAAILLGGSAQQVERVSNAIRAGLPR